MSDKVRKQASAVGYALWAWGAMLMIVYPAHVALAQEQVAIPVPDVLIDLLSSLAFAAVPAVIVELFRLSIPWLSRKHESNDLQKTVLRVMALAWGIVFGLSGFAPSIADGSHPRLMGGIAAGAFAALFGGTLIGQLRKRLKAL